MLVVSEKALNTLLEKGIIKKEKNNSVHIYKTEHGYLEKKMYAGEVFIDVPTTIEKPEKVENYTQYAIDLLSYKERIKEIENELSKYSDNTAYLKPNSSLTARQVNEIVREYKMFLKGGRNWKHTDEASRYGISTSTLKRCLKSQNIYDKDKHKRKNNLPK